MTDPMEKMVRDALVREGFQFSEEGDGERRLDFFLADYSIHIEVKQFHSPRIAEQMASAPNVIAVQGREAVEFFAALLCDYKKAMAA